MTSSLFRRSVAVAAIVAAFQSGAVTARAQSQNVTLTGVVSCDATTGHQLVTWTLSSIAASELSIQSANVNGGGMVTQGPIDLTATFSKNPLQPDDSTTAVTAVTGNGTGDLHLVVSWLENGDPGSIDGEVVMPGGCTLATTTTTARSTTSTAAASTTTTRAPSVSATPSFTG